MNPHLSRRLNPEMTVKDLLRKLHDGLEAGWLTPDMRVIMCDDKERGHRDPVECFEYIASGPGEYDKRRIGYAKYLKLNDEYKKYLTDLGNNVQDARPVNEVTIEDDKMYCTPRVETIGGRFDFRDGMPAKNCMLLLNDASSW